jgi:hypothetical protein
MKPQGGGGWCTAVPDGQDTGGSPNWPPGPAPAHALGVDSCLLGSNSCSPTANIGATTWDCVTYWAVNHTQLNPSHAAPSGCSTNTISRFDVYTYEITHGYQSDLANTTPAANRETGTPQCTGPTPTANRRIMNVAMINCRSSPVPIQSNAQNVPVAAFGQFFLTHAVTNQTNPYAEFRGLVDRGSGTIKDQVQLYR